MRRLCCSICCWLVSIHFLALGCASPKVITIQQQRPSEHLPDFVLHLPGVGGYMSIDRGMLRGLQEGGLEHADVEVYDWTNGDRGFGALVAYDRNQEQAQIIADKITARYRADPRAKIYVTCHSGGAGVAVWALEKLPDDVQIETLLMLSPALSPQYDLSPALRHVRTKAHAFTSTGDLLVLGAGTRMFGTMDRVKIDAAGRIGFATPDAPEYPDQYRKLVAWPYDPDWMQYGNIGDHIGNMTRSFARNVLAPVLLNGTLATAHVEPVDRS